MAVGPVNQALLESNFQSPGDIYLDTKTEGAFQVVVDQVNANAGIFTTGGSALLFSDTIPSVTGNTVYDQLVFMEQQIQAITGGVIAPGTVVTAMIQNGAVTHIKLEPSEQTASVGGTQFLYLTNGGGI